MLKKISISLILTFIFMDSNASAKNFGDNLIESLNFDIKRILSSNITKDRKDHYRKLATRLTRSCESPDQYIEYRCISENVIKICINSGDICRLFVRTWANVLSSSDYNEYRATREAQTLGTAYRHYSKTHDAQNIYNYCLGHLHENQIDLGFCMSSVLLQVNSTEN